MEEKLRSEQTVGQLQKNKGAGKWLVGIIVLAALLLVGAGLLLGGILQAGPASRLAKGIVNLTLEVQTYRNPVLKEAGIGGLVTENSPVNLQTAWNVTVPDMPTVGFDLDACLDRKNKEAAANLRLSAYNIALADINLAVEDDLCYLQIPQLFSQTYYLDLAHLGQDYQNSAWKEFLGFDMDESLSVDLFSQTETDEAEFDKELLKLINSYKDALKDGVAIEKTGETRTVLVEGKEVKLTGIAVVMDKTTVNDLLENLHDLLEENGMDTRALDFSLKKDLELVFFLDKKNQIRMIETQSPIKVSGGAFDSLKFEFTFSGAERCLDEIQGKITVSTDESEQKLKLERTAEVGDGEYDSVLVVRNNDVCLTWSEGYCEDGSEVYYDLLAERGAESIHFRADGEWKDIKEGERFTFVLGKGILEKTGEDGSMGTLLTLSGSTTLQNTAQEIEIPQDAVHFLKMSDEEILVLVWDVMRQLNTNGLIP